MPDKGPPLSLGQIIRRQRELSEVSMRKVANLAGISNPYLSQIERGLREPSDRVVSAIATALNSSADALYEQAGVRQRTTSSPGPVESAIQDDPDLTARQRQALLEVYRSFAGKARRAPRGAGPAASGE